MPFSRYLLKNTKSPDQIALGNKRIARLIYPAFGIISIFLIWAAIGYALFSRHGYEHFSGFLPIPTLYALYDLFLAPDFWASLWASLRRVIVGIFFAFIFGVPSGLLIGYYHKCYLITHTPIQFVRMISPLSWMPIALLVFQQFETAIYFLIMMSTVWPIILNTIHGVSSVNPQWINMARNQGAKDHQILLQVIIPSSIGHTLTSLRLALGVAWIVLVPAEYLGISSGLGYLINDARDTLEYDRLMAIVIAIGIIGFILDGLIQSFQKYRNWS